MDKNNLLLFDIDDTLFDTHTFKRSNLTNFSLYDDVIPSLTVLSQKATLGILSEGETDFQMKKLYQTHCADFFQQKYIHIFLSKKASFYDIFAIYGAEFTVWYIEDRLSMLAHAKQAYPTLHAVWIQRGRYAKDQHHNSFKPDYRITSLIEIEHMVFPRV